MIRAFPTETIQILQLDAATKNTYSSGSLAVGRASRHSTSRAFELSHDLR